MVKTVVKPLLKGLFVLLESAKKSINTRLFGVFNLG